MRNKIIKKNGTIVKKKMVQTYGEGIPIVKWEKWCHTNLALLFYDEDTMIRILIKYYLPCQIIQVIIYGHVKKKL